MPVSRGMSGVAGRKNSLNDNNPHPFVRHMKRTSTVFDQHHKLHCNFESWYKDVMDALWENKVCFVSWLMYERLKVYVLFVRCLFLT